MPTALTDLVSEGDSRQYLATITEEDGVTPLSKDLPGLTVRFWLWALPPAPSDALNAALWTPLVTDVDVLNDEDGRGTLDTDGHLTIWLYSLDNRIIHAARGRERHRGRVVMTWTGGHGKTHDFEFTIENLPGV